MTFYSDTSGATHGQAGESGALIPSVSIEALLQRRAALHDLVEQIGALIAKADELAAAGGFESVSRYIDANQYSGNYRANVTSVEGRAALRKTLDAQGWRYLLHESGIRSFMPASKRKEWDEAICDGKVPELNRDSIVGTFAQLYEDRGALLEQGVIEVFKRLSWVYKTNRPEAFGKKIIRAYAVTMGSINHRFSDEMDDLLRIFHKLDGKAEPDHRSGAYGRLYAAMSERTDYVDDYLHIRVYRKAQTAHVTFKRPDLVERMNQILAKHYPDALPAARP